MKSIFTSQTRCPVTFFQPLGACSLSSRTSKAAPMLYISLARVSNPHGVVVSPVYFIGMFHPVSLSLDTTPGNVDPTGSGILCPSSTHLAFLVKSIFTSQTRCPVTFFQPLGSCSVSSRTLNTTPMLYISLARASIHIVLSFHLSSSLACSTPVGISIPYLWVTFLTLMLTAVMIVSLL